MYLIQADGFTWVIREESRVNNKYQDQLGSERREAPNLDVMMAIGGGTLVDIGACVGGFAIRASRFYEHVLAFEPNPINMKGLKMNIEQNGLQNVEPLEVGVGKRNESFFLSLNGGGSKRGRTKKSTLVNSRPLDTFTLTEVALIKIDTEGMELDVLEGGEETIMLNRPVLLIETHEKTYKDDLLLKGQTEEIINWLQERKFRVVSLFKTQCGDDHLLAYPEALEEYFKTLLKPYETTYSLVF